MFYADVPWKNSSYSLALEMDMESHWRGGKITLKSLFLGFIVVIICVWVGCLFWFARSDMMLFLNGKRTEKNAEDSTIWNCDFNGKIDTLFFSVEFFIVLFSVGRRPRWTSK